LLRHGTCLAVGGTFDQTPSWEVTVTRTFGAAIGALLFVLFMSYIATRLAHPVVASPAPQASISKR
jgi:flagellar biogenesis protein FliO